MPHVMSVPKFEHFFRAAASLDIDKADIARFDDFIEEVRLLRDVPRAEKQQAVAGEAVATRPPGFLIVGFDALG